MSRIFEKYFSILIVTMDKFKTRIKNLRLENKLSQNALAQKIKSSQKTIDYWESGASEPKAGFIIALADCFGVTADYLLGREDDFGNVNVMRDLSESEKQLLGLFGDLNKKEREEALNFMGYLLSKRA